MPLYDPKFAELDFDAGGDDDPTPVGVLLCSFELRAYQPPKSLEAPDGSRAINAIKGNQGRSHLLEAPDAPKSAAIVDLSSQVMSADCFSNCHTECH